jgi:hypothetical protein
MLLLYEYSVIQGSKYDYKAEKSNETPLIHHSDRGLHSANDYQNTLNKRILPHDANSGPI